ncbi:DNA polymerase III subunit alpha [Sporosarcina limicola]|uniref:DNA-directed DNA polymerase n=1 Tax=Sporosarcina limicola TaxID=34101 RepID=A0A927R2W4_9BACL|nr:DNA polymerase III subunit alpha [Sporosarcina limicola]MBE1554401.1 DNA polymerase-3 subunit alpha [Sporosarcina limicola]
MKLVYPQVVTGADLLRGIIKLDRLAPLLQRRGARSVAIVNSKLYGIRSFYKVMVKHGIHPVIGLSVLLDVGEGEVVLLYVYAKDDEGFRNLLKMSSAISTRDSGMLPLQWLKAYSAGCIIICPLTDVSWDTLRTKEEFHRIMNGCGNSIVFIGVGRRGGTIHPDEGGIEAIAGETNTTIVAIHESRYVAKEDAFAYEVAEAIRTGFKLNDPARPVSMVKDAYVPEESELGQWFSDKPEWLENIAKILLSCNATLPPSKTLMPLFPVPIGETATTLLEKNCVAGLQSRLGSIEESYQNRLRYEIEIICQMGFADYFLIVEDFIRYAKKHDILTGPGRGSSAGSLVAFALGITDVDPVRYGLIFERFLNPGRVSMPDIDIDFADNRRAEVIDYVAQKYGKANVAQIITFGTLSARSVTRNVARVFDFSNEEMAFLSKEIPNRHGVMLEDAIRESKALRDWIAIDPVRSKWFDAATLLEGLPRNASTHAAGVILSPIPLVETVPLQDGADGIYLTQWSMGDVEEQGLLKMDFLGLRNLTLLDRIRAMMTYDTGVRLDFEKIPLDDEKTFELFRSGDMAGVFQFESDGMRDTLRIVQPNRFEDIFAITALYRPGPMDNIPLFSRRKNNNEAIAYTHPQLESVLVETYGIIVYQEQIMQIAVNIAGFTMGEADLLRRAISKKNRDILQEERVHFTQNAVNNGFPESAAIEVYDLIVKFADYGFPKSHAVAYSLISYRLAYLKANKPAYFYAGLLSSTTGNHDKTMALMREAESRNVQILPPSIKRSKYMYAVEKDSIRIGLSAIKGVTPIFYNALKAARKTSGKWKTLFDMAANLGGSYFTEKAIRPLIKAGALDDFGETRAVLLTSINAAISHALFVRPDQEGDLLSEAFFSVASPKYSPGGTMPRMMLLEYEREVLGFYLSEHPAEEVKKRVLGEYGDISSVLTYPDRKSVKIVGLIIEIKHIRTKKGESMAFVTVQDNTDQISCTFFPKQYTTSSSHLIEMAMIHVEGIVERRRGKAQILVQRTESK